MNDHGTHEARAQQLGTLVDKKNKAYGNSFEQTGAILRILYPRGIALEQYDDALFVTRVLDKLFRVSTRKHAFGENPIEDICGYSLLKVVIDEKTNSEYPGMLEDKLRNMQNAQKAQRVANRYTLCPKKEEKDYDDIEL